MRAARDPIKTTWRSRSTVSPSRLWATHPVGWSLEEHRDEAMAPVAPASGRQPEPSELLRGGYRGVELLFRSGESCRQIATFDAGDDGDADHVAHLGDRDDGG